MAQNPLELKPDAIWNSATGVTVPAFVCVTRATDALDVRLPPADNHMNFVGTTIIGQNAAGSKILVRRSGIVKVRATEAIAIGQLLNVEMTTGYVKLVDEAEGVTINVVGIADSASVSENGVLYVYMLICPFTAVKLTATAGAL